MRLRLIPFLLGGMLLAGGAGALAQAEAERRLEAAIAQLRSALGPEARLEIGGRRVDPVSGRAALADVAITHGTDRVTIPELILSELGDGRVGRAELRRPSHRGSAGASDADRLVLTGLAIPAPGAVLAIETLAFEAVEIEGLRVAESKGKLALARLAIEGWRDGSVGAARLEGLDLTMTGQAAGPLRVSLGRAELRDWQPGRPTLLRLDDLRAGGLTQQLGQLELRLDRIELSGVDGAGTLAALRDDRQVPDPFDGMPQRLAIEGFHAEAEGQPLLALRRLLSETRLERGLLSGRLATEGFRLSLPRGQAAWLQALGYREIAGGIEIAGAAPRAGGRLDIDPVRIAWDQAATLTLTAWLDGLPTTPEARTPIDRSAALAAWAAMRLGALTLTLRDHGLLGRIVAQQAREQRIPDARLREQWAQMVLALPLPGAAPAKGSDPLLSLREALAAFIRQPGTLEIALRPPQPLRFEELAELQGDLAAGLQRLGLTARAR